MAVITKVALAPGTGTMPPGSYVQPRGDTVVWFAYLIGACAIVSACAAVVQVGMKIYKWIKTERLAADGAAAHTTGAVHLGSMNVAQPQAMGEQPGPRVGGPVPDMSIILNDRNDETRSVQEEDNNSRSQTADARSVSSQMQAEGESIYGTPMHFVIRLENVETSTSNSQIDGNQTTMTEPADATDTGIAQHTEVEANDVV